ncbi:hypothetical protein TorRG33x02_028530 [Trema orientale]|uniref:Uncharacterized protein n=1 Tax=Trema orientale TaxID=63057 RepID=A0A2P5FUS8_TREOI|nr:hypothetical protein TorRG33x02_028530 [Trema orientale]
MERVVDYMVPWTLLAPVLHELLLLCRLEEHIGPCPIDHFQQLTPEMMSLSFTCLCYVIIGMNKTRVGDVCEELLRDWQCRAMFLKRLGFRIGFLFELLKRATFAFVGLL